MVIGEARYLLDTNVLSEPVRALPNPGIVSRLREAAHVCVTAAPVWHELLFGVRRMPASRRRRSTELYLSNQVRARFEILPYDAAAADWHAGERARLVSIGMTPPFIDGQIAAIAATNGLTLVSASLADFLAFEGLRLEDWRS